MEIILYSHSWLIEKIRLISCDFYHGIFQLKDWFDYIMIYIIYWFIFNLIQLKKKTIVAGGRSR